MHSAVLAIRASKDAIAADVADARKSLHFKHSVSRRLRTLNLTTAKQLILTNQLVTSHANYDWYIVMIGILYSADGKVRELQGGSKAFASKN